MLMAMKNPSFSTSKKAKLELNLFFYENLSCNSDSHGGAQENPKKKKKKVVEFMFGHPSCN
jgi:hypothetical protein